MLSLVLPLYNESETIGTLIKRIAAAGVGWGDYEVIFVDDGSTDGTAAALAAALAADKRLKLVQFSRNFGHQIAVSAGLRYARGDAVVVMDGDLQDPPELIASLLARWREGYRVVYAVRTARRESAVKRLAYATFYRTLRAVASIDIPLDTGDFCLLDRAVVDAINVLPEKNRFLRGLRCWVGFASIGVPYERDERFAGASKYTWRKLLRLAADGIVGFSTMPLKIAAYAGLLVAGFSFAGGIALLILKLTHGIALQGWTSLVLAIFFMGGVQLLMLGIVGEYVARIYIEVQNRPLYVVKKTVGLHDGPMSTA